MITNMLKFLAVIMFICAAFMSLSGATEMQIARMQLSGLTCAVAACWCWD